MNKTDIINSFDPSGAAEHEGIFGLPFSLEHSNIVLLPVTWEGTVSYGKGTAQGPEAIYEASFQVDLYDPHVKDAWKSGIHLSDIKYQWDADAEEQELVNKKSDEVNNWVAEEANQFLTSGKIVGLIGGEHSCPYGLIKVLSEKHNNLSILQIDAHADLRKAYEGYTHSHASIMYNAIQLDGVKQLTQVGIRDFCDEELHLIETDQRIKTFFDHDIKSNLYSGSTWDSICNDIINSLTDQVYISFDIDGLIPNLCPNTGTPVPGGLEFEQAIHLLNKLVDSGKKIVGFDLCEVAPGDDEWDGNVGARILYKLCNFTAKSNGLT